MKTSAHILQFMLAALIVVMLGGLAGWYVFVQREAKTNEATGQSRGFGSDPTFGGAAGSTYENVITGITETGSTQSTRAPRLWQITKSPVAGAGFSTSTLAYFIERSTGNLLSADPLSSEIVRITNTLFPEVQEATVAPDGSAILRFVKETGQVETFAGRIASSTEGATLRALVGTYLPQGILSIAREPEGKQSLAYLVQGADGGATLATAAWSGANQKTVLSLPLSDWHLLWTKSGFVLAQKASDNLEGYAYRVSSGGTMVPLVAAQSGLTVLPHPDGTALIFGTSEGGSLSLFVQTGTAEATRLSLRTRADKCVWAPHTGQAAVAYCAVPLAASTGNNLEAAYQGESHPGDAWWRIDAKSGTAENMYTPEGASIDAENVMIDSAGTQLLFMNAADKTLWMLRIAE